jgi:hypothetical protein
MCRTYGAGVDLDIRTQRFRAGLTSAAPDGAELARCRNACLEEG